MYLINEDNSIYATRGDIVSIKVTAQDNEKAYTFKAGDILRIKIFGKKDCETVVLQKDFAVAVDTESVDIFLDENDTKIGETISKPKDYWYEIELNPDTNPQTIIGYDDDGAKVFKLFPEGEDINEDTPITPEDIPIVDEALDITSDRPVENKAIAKAIIGLKADIDTVKADADAQNDEVVTNANRLEREIAVERARINTFTKLTEGSTTGDAELADIRIGADGKTYNTAGEAVREQFSNIGGQQISPELIEGLTDDLTVSYTDSKFATSYKDFSSYDGLSCGIANIAGYENVVVMCYVEPTKAEFPVVFCTSTKTLQTGNYTEWETINKDLGIYKIKVPLGATLAKFNIYTNKKEYAYCKGVKYVKKHLDWLQVESDNIGASAVKKIVDSTLNVIGSENKDNGRYKYSDSLNKPFDFNGKHIAAFGDSITAGTTSPNLQNGTPYIKHFAEGVGATLTNLAVGGTCIADKDTTYSIYNKVLSYNASANFIFVAGGTNDFNTGKELGGYADTSTDTFYGCLRGICEHISKNFADSEVIFITPIPYTSASRYHNATNDRGYTLNDYRNAIYEIATLYGFNVVDGSDLGMPDESGNWANEMCDDSDGCHPSAKGHKLYARNLAGKLC